MSKKKAKKAKKKKPSINGSNSVGRGKNGQFIKGNRCSVGNDGHRDGRVKWLKKALYDAVTEKDINAIAKKLVAKAKQGDVQAAKELFDRLWGRAMQEIEAEVKLQVKTGEKLPVEEMRMVLEEFFNAGTGIPTE